MNRIIVSILAGTAALLPVIFDSALKGAVLLTVVALIVLFMRRASPAARHLVWLTGIAALSILPFLSAGLPGWRVLPDWTAMPLPSVYSEPVGSEPVPGPGVFPPLAKPTLQSARENAKVFAIIPPPRQHAASWVPSTPGKPLSDNLGLWIGGIWAGVAALLFLRLIGYSYWTRISKRRAEVVSEGPLVEALEEARYKLGVSRRVLLLLEERRIVPLVWGVFGSRLVLPMEARTWDEARLRSVLLHELAHVKRHDLLVMLLTQVVCAVYWFNPLVWLAAWRMHVERERACDDLVLNSGVKASDYAEHLLQIATKLETGGLVGTLAMAKPSRLEGRLLAVLREGSNRSGITRAFALAAICFAVGSVVPVAMLQAANKEKSLTQIAQAPVKAAEFSTVPEKPWTVTGSVIGPASRPLANAEIRVYAGWGSLRPVGSAITGADGRYAISFGRGVIGPLNKPNLQAAIVTVRKEGYYENNLNRHGARAGALREVPAEDLKSFGITGDQLFLPGQPQVINFAMAPAAQIKGRLLGTGAFSILAVSSLTPEERKKERERAPDRPTGHVKIRQSPLPHWRIWLSGKHLPPASSVLASAETDADGNFVFESVPLDFEWHFQTERQGKGSEPRSPSFKLNRAGDVKFELELLEDQNTLGFLQEDGPPKQNGANNELRRGDVITGHTAREFSATHTYSARLYSDLAALLRTHAEAHPKVRELRENIGLEQSGFTYRAAQ